jgi:DNA polymerase III alpha subunit
LNQKKNPKKIKYLHKDLAPVLAETYGILVYQEQVMEIAHSMAGYTLGEADNLRRAMGKKKKKNLSPGRYKKGTRKFWLKMCLTSWKNLRRTASINHTLLAMVLLPIGPLT